MIVSRSLTAAARNAQARSKSESSAIDQPVRSPAPAASITELMVAPAAISSSTISGNP